MKKSYIISGIVFCILFIFLLGNNVFLIYRITRVDKEVDTIQKHMWGYPWNKKKDLNESKYYTYSWFKLGTASHQIVDRHFYISNIETVYRENGFEISGTIGNTTSMPMNIVNIECAVSDSTQEGRVAIGSSELPYLYSGYKDNFSVFIPTSKKNVLEIGIKIKNYRM